jgi:hypothetical protein
MSGKRNRSRQFSVVIPWCDRNEVQGALARNARWFQAYSAEVLLINCGGDSFQLSSLLSQLRLPFIRRIDVPRVRFNKSLALNIGTHFSRAPHILVLDSDIIIQTDIFSRAGELLNSRNFITLDRINESNPEYTWIPQPKPKKSDSPSILALERIYEAEFKWTDRTSTCLETNRENLVDGTRGGPGILLVRRQDLLRVDGYNSDLEFWGWEDADIQLRLRRVLQLAHVRRGCALHLSHDDGRRALAGGDRHKSHLANLALLCSRYATGDFSGTYTRDVAVWKDQIGQISRLPVLDGRGYNNASDD